MSYHYFSSASSIQNIQPQSNYPQQSDNPFAPNYKAVSKNYYPPEFYKKRPEVIARFSDRCFLCNELANEIHHLDYDTMNNNKNNLILLCKSCHAKTNSSRNYWKESLKNKMELVFHFHYDKEDYE
jgi:hypothetical protein